MVEENVLTQKRKWNWRIWLGFLIALAAIPVYAAVFSRYPATRNVPWATWPMFVLAVWLLWTGVRRAYANPREYRGKIFGTIFGVLTVAIGGLFAAGTLYFSRQLPPSGGAPQIGAKAPEFTLPDATGKMVSLSALLTDPLPGAAGAAAGAKPRGVVLIFYRGYW